MKLPRNKVSRLEAMRIRETDRNGPTGYALQQAQIDLVGAHWTIERSRTAQREAEAAYSALNTQFRREVVQGFSRKIEEATSRYIREEVVKRSREGGINPFETFYMKIVPSEILTLPGMSRFIDELRSELAYRMETSAFERPGSIYAAESYVTYRLHIPAFNLDYSTTKETTRLFNGEAH